MKMLRLFVVLVSVFIGSNLWGAKSEEFQVKVAVEAPALKNYVKIELVNKAKTEALKKYLLRLDSNMPQDVVRKACAEVDKFVEEMEEKNTKWIDIAKNLGQLEGSFIVELNLEEINQWLKIIGVKTQGKIELTILEEPPSLGSMPQADGKAFFKTYTNFQRRVRDRLIKKMDEFGFDVILLADNDLYKGTQEYDKDNMLVGTYYDPEKNTFVVNKKLLDAVRDNNPDTVILYYRLEAVEYSAADKEVRVTVALSLKSLNTNVTKSFATGVYKRPYKASSAALLADEIGFVAEEAILKLLNAEGAAQRLNDLVMELRNAAKRDAGPIKININAAVIDGKIRKKVMYMLRKQLLEKGIVTTATAKINGLYAEAKPEFKSVEELYIEKISPIFEELGVELDDDKVFYGNNTLTIKP